MNVRDRKTRNTFQKYFFDFCIVFRLPHSSELNFIKCIDVHIWQVADLDKFSPATPNKYNALWKKNIKKNPTKNKI